MSGRLQRGFTIIELVLFLGVTGALFAGLMVGVNTNINTQRYKESAMSFKSLLEKQFSDVAYPRNDRDGTWSCTSEAGVVSNPVGGTPRGTSGCVMLGRYLSITDDGTKLKTGDVVGVEPTSTTADSLVGDIAVLQAYAPRTSPIDIETTDVGWQSRLQTSSHTTAATSFVIVRSPQSGILRTFVTAEPLPEQLTSIITEVNATAVSKTCILPSGFVAVPVHSVSVNPAVGSANGVVLNEDDSSC